MANEIRYYDTPHTYISPVRYYKANDPYYYEVDNIPIKQLEESQKFLKDQVDGIIARQNTKKETIEIDRSGFSELRPYATGNDRKVRVKPGKFTARINNAYNLTPLQIIEQIDGFSNTKANNEIATVNTWRSGTNKNTALSNVLDEFQQGLLGNALNMNGLAERTFVFPFYDEDGWHLGEQFESYGTSAPGYFRYDAQLDPDDRPLYPNYVGALLKHNTSETTRDLQLIQNVYSTTDKPYGGQQGRIESDFIKRWRGAIRTSVVDVPEELEITVPDFDYADYYYTDTNGERQALNANQRIDLLFIYTKAVDEEATTIPKFDSNGNPTILTKPALGILKGAGIGISRDERVTATATNPPGTAPGLQLQGFVSRTEPDDRVDLQTLDGVPIMLAHPGDENGTNNGFTTSAGVIRGSFPSPDDLMNLAPALSENLETTAFQLIGQSILPIAYIRVQTPGGPIADLITSEDIIDIRPFFRTTELAYNERAGIAAATPQVSIANPVVTEAHLDKVRREVYGDLSDRMDSVETSLAGLGEGLEGIQGPGNSGARIVAAGNVLGGMWGPEGALLKQTKESAAGGHTSVPLNQLIDLVETEFGYPNGSIPYYPNWDKALWYRQGNYTGDSICDSINLGHAAFAEFDGPQNNVKWMPPWKGNRANGESETIGDIKTAFGTERFSMYEWGPSLRDTAGRYGGGRPYLVGLTESIFGSETPGFNSEQRDSINARGVQINYVTKRIKLDFTATPWVNDYHVKLNFLHCTPLSDYRKTILNNGENQGQGDLLSRNSCQAWVQKYRDYFIICVAWAGTNISVKTAGRNMPWNDRNNPEKFAGFVQPQMDLLAGGSFERFDATAFGKSVNYTNQSQRDNFFNQQAIGPTGRNTNYTKRGDPSWFPGLVPLVYPSIQWEVVGVADNFVFNSHGADGGKMRELNPTVICG